jgi:hypothetical protein
MSSIHPRFTAGQRNRPAVIPDPMRRIGKLMADLVLETPRVVVLGQLGDHSSPYSVPSCKEPWSGIVLCELV